MAMLAADAEEELQGRQSEDRLKQIAALGEEAREIEHKQGLLQAAMDDLRERYKEILEVELPKIMDECGMERFDLSDGTSVLLAQEYYASISAENQSKAYAWLRKNGHGDIIKNETTVAFGMGEDKQAQSLIAELRRRKLAFVQKESIHPGSLRKFVREEIERDLKLAKQTFPRALFNVFDPKVAKLKVPKEQKGGKGGKKAES